MNKLIISGAGGLGREIAWLVERINEKSSEWQLEGFTDSDPLRAGTELNGVPIIGSDDILADYPDAYVAVAIAAPRTRKRVAERLRRINPDIRFATLIDPSVISSRLVSIGEGCIICAGCILTVNVTLASHVIVNPGCVISHGAVLDDYVTLYPSVNVCGDVHIGAQTELGVGTRVIQGISIGKNTMIGAGAVVVRNIPDSCTAVGVPARPLVK